MKERESERARVEEGSRATERESNVETGRLAKYMGGWANSDGRLDWAEWVEGDQRRV